MLTDYERKYLPSDFEDGTRVTPGAVSALIRVSEMNRAQNMIF